MLGQPAHEPGSSPYVRGVSDQQPTGSFIRSQVIHGVRYEIFGLYDEDVRDEYVRFDIYDEDGNYITEKIVLEHLPSESEVYALARRWHAARTVLVLPTFRGWQIVWVGEDVTLGLHAAWWPWF